MSDHVYKHIELTGSSKTSIEDAVSNALAKANETVRNIQCSRLPRPGDTLSTAKWLTGRSASRRVLRWNEPGGVQLIRVQ